MSNRKSSQWPSCVRWLMKRTGCLVLSSRWHERSYARQGSGWQLFKDKMCHHRPTKKCQPRKHHGAQQILKVASRRWETRLKSVGQTLISSTLPMFSPFSTLHGSASQLVESSSGHDTYPKVIIKGFLQTASMGNS